MAIKSRIRRKKAFEILLVELLSIPSEAHSKDVSKKVTKPVRIDQNKKKNEMNKKEKLISKQIIIVV